ncbi:PhlD [Streptomyces sp. NPDC001941]|uniref:PhlD n=1 Tax=Streptomyces sp. NPDC001941 TaxID=3154659 RepID=UPI00331F5A4C
MAYVNRPGLADAAHMVTTEEIVADIDAHYPGHPNLRAMRRIADATIGVHTRRFVRPLHMIGPTQSFETRNEWTVQAVCDLGARAARHALDLAGVSPKDIGTIITFHATGLAIPGLDVHVSNSLGLPVDASRVPMSQLACAGGAHAVKLAAQLARPGRHVLVVGAEALSTVYQHSDASKASMIYKLLFGDGGAAAVVSTEPLAQPGLRIDETWEYVHRADGRGTEQNYRLRAQTDGYHFDSTPESVRAIADVIPQVPWLKDGEPPADFGLVHPGSPTIIDRVVQAGACTEHGVRHSRATLAEYGNTGGSAVLRVLERTHDDPPRSGETGFLVGFGPGFVAAAARGTWVGSGG